MDFEINYVNGGKIELYGYLVGVGLGMLTCSTVRQSGGK